MKLHFSSNIFLSSKNFGINLNSGLGYFLSKSSLESVIIGVSEIMETIATSIVVLFCIITWSGVELFRQLNSKIDKLSNPLFVASSAELAVHFDSIRRQHTLACKLVDEIQSFFGVIVLIALAHSFVSLITDSFEIATALKSYNLLSSTFLCFLGQHLIIFSLICYGCDMLQSEVFSMICIFSSSYSMALSFTRL